MNLKIKFFILAILFPLATMNAKTIKTISSLDIKRYMGLWYEIARFENRFEKNLVGVTAEYTLKENGQIKVINSGHVKTLDGPVKRAKGKARQPDPLNPGALEVSFFLWFYASYNILLLDERNYSYALIGSNNDKYLWLLSRTPHLDKVTLSRIIKYAKESGYDTSKLYYTPQPQHSILQ